MVKAHKPSDSECYTPSSEPFRFYFCILMSIALKHTGLRRVGKWGRKQSSACRRKGPCFLLGLPFSPQVRGDMLIRNVELSRHRHDNLKSSTSKCTVHLGRQAKFLIRHNSLMSIYYITCVRIGHALRWMISGWGVRSSVSCEPAYSWALWHTQTLFSENWMSFSGGNGGLCTKLTTDLHVVPRLRRYTYGTVCSSSLWLCSGTVLPV
jgi:hypothetical protein